MLESVESQIRKKYYELKDTIPSKEAEIFDIVPKEEQDSIIRQYVLPEIRDLIINTLNEEQIKDKILNHTDEEKDDFLLSVIAHTLHLEKTKKRFLVFSTNLASGRIESAFQNKSEKTKFFNDLDGLAPHETSSLSRLPSNQENTFFIIKRYGDSSQEVEITLTKQNLPDLSHVIIIGDASCAGYKFPKSSNDIPAILNTLPFAVFGKFDCSTWSKDLFKQIKILPLAETIDCSHSISNLDDLNGKLPLGLEKLIVQSTLLKGEKRNDAEKFLEENKKKYPNLVITDKDDKYTISLAIIKEHKAKQSQQTTLDSMLQKASKQNKYLNYEDLRTQKNEPEQQEPPIIFKDEHDIDQRDVRNLLQENNDIFDPIKENLEQMLRLDDFKKSQNAQDILKTLVDKAFRAMNDKIVKKTRPDKEHTVVNCLKQADLPTVAELIQQYLTESIEQIKDKLAKNSTTSTQYKPKSDKPKKHVSKATQEQEVSVHKGQHIIQIYIKQSDLNKAPDLALVLKKFNVWPQPDYIIRSSNPTCCFVDKNGRTTKLNGIKLKNKSSLSYENGSARHDFKIARLIDVYFDDKGRQKEKPVLDEYGKEIFVMVCQDYISDHSGRKTGKQHTKNIRTEEIFVTKTKLNTNQQQKIRKDNNKKINFFSLEELDETYKCFTYDPYAKPENQENKITEPTNKDIPMPSKESVARIDSNPNEASFKPVNLQPQQPEKPIEQKSKQDDTLENAFSPEQLVAELYGYDCLITKERLAIILNKYYNIFYKLGDIIQKNKKDNVTYYQIDKTHLKDMAKTINNKLKSHVLPPQEAANLYYQKHKKPRGVTEQDLGTALLILCTRLAEKPTQENDAYFTKSGAHYFLYQRDDKDILAEFIQNNLPYFVSEQPQSTNIIEAPLPNKTNVGPEQTEPQSTEFWTIAQLAKQLQCESQNILNHIHNILNSPSRADEKQEIMNMFKKSDNKSWLFKSELFSDYEKMFRNKRQYKLRTKKDVKEPETPVEELSETWSIHQLAKELGISKDQVRQGFKKLRRTNDKMLSKWFIKSEQTYFFKPAYTNQIKQYFDGFIAEQQTKKQNALVVKQQEQTSKKSTIPEPLQETNANQEKTETKNLLDFKAWEFITNRYVEILTGQQEHLKSLQQKAENINAQITERTTSGEIDESFVELAKEAVSVRQEVDQTKDKIYQTEQKIQSLKSGTALLSERIKIQTETAKLEKQLQEQKGLLKNTDDELMKIWQLFNPRNND